MSGRLEPETEIELQLREMMAKAGLRRSRYTEAVVKSVVAEMMKDKKPIGKDDTVLIDVTKLGDKEPQYMEVRKDWRHKTLTGQEVSDD